MTGDAAPRRRGRTIGIAQQVANETGLSLRTIQRVLAARREQTESDEDKMLRRFLETFRNFASFCRENSVEQIASLQVSEDQAEKLREWNGLVLPWLQRLNGDHSNSAPPSVMPAKPIE